jgi:hypothetical protein
MFLKAPSVHFTRNVKDDGSHPSSDEDEHAALERSNAHDLPSKVVDTYTARKSCWKSFFFFLFYIYIYIYCETHPSSNEDRNLPDVISQPGY